MYALKLSGWLLVCAASLALAGKVAASPSHLLLVGNTGGNDVAAFDERSGRSLGSFIKPGSGGLSEPDAMSIGPDGRLYVSSGTTAENSAILRFDARDGHFIDRFAYGGGLVRPYGHAFGPDGMLYVSSYLTDQILRFDAHSGKPIDVLVTGTGRPGGTNGPNALTFGPDGMLYVSTEGSVRGSFAEPLPSEVLRIDTRTGSAEVFIAQPEPSSSSPGFVSLLGLAFGPDCGRCERASGESGRCDLFVSDFANDIRRYDRHGQLVAQYSTNYTGTVPSSNAIGGLAFGPHGHLFTVGFDLREDDEMGAVLRFDTTRNAPHPRPTQSGALFVPPNSQLKRPIGIVVVPGH
jgi:DNA-binding beta-propeller fold protein YncE